MKIFQREKFEDFDINSKNNNNLKTNINKKISWKKNSKNANKKRFNKSKSRNKRKFKSKSKMNKYYYILLIW